MVSDDLLKTLAEDGCQSNGPPVIKRISRTFKSMIAVASFHLVVTAREAKPEHK